MRQVKLNEKDIKVISNMSEVLNKGNIIEYMDGFGYDYDRTINYYTCTDTMVFRKREDVEVGDIGVYMLDIRDNMLIGGMKYVK